MLRKVRTLKRIASGSSGRKIETLGWISARDDQIGGNTRENLNMASHSQIWSQWNRRSSANTRHMHTTSAMVMYIQRTTDSKSADHTTSRGSTIPSNE